MMQYQRSQGSIRSPPDYDGRSPTYNGSYMVHNDIRGVLPEAELPPYEKPPEYVPPAEVSISNLIKSTFSLGLMNTGYFILPVFITEAI